MRVIQRVLGLSTQPFATHHTDSDTLNVEVAMLKKTAPRVKPTDTLFVVNFDKDKTRDSDMEDFFKGYVTPPPRERVWTRLPAKVAI